MRKIRYFKMPCCALLALMAVGSLSSCNDENDEFDDRGGSSVLSLTTADETVYMGDSIQFSFKVAASGARLNQTKLQLWLNGEMVNEKIYLTPDNGEYSGKLAVPFLKDISDTRAKVVVRTQNTLMANAYDSIFVNVKRPQFPKLVLKIGDRSYDMTASGSDPYEYSVEGVFPTEFKGLIEVPAYGKNGNDMVFGNSDGSIVNGVRDSIEFAADVAEGTKFAVTFNTKNYQATPRIKFAVNDIEFEKIDDTNFGADLILEKGDEVVITGLKAEYSEYWINPAWFRVVKGTDGKTLRFQGIKGLYRINVDKSLKYFRVLPVKSGAAMSATDKWCDHRDGDVAAWIIGDGNFGLPTTGNAPNWGTSWKKVIAACPVEDGKYQIIFEQGKSLNSANFKFYYQCGWGSSWGSEGPGAVPTVTGGSWFSTASGDGNIKNGATSRTDGKFYVLTLDVTEGDSKPKLNLEEWDSIPEVD